MRQVRGINPGRLDKRVQILRYKDVTTELGDRTNQLVHYKTVWAEIRPLRGSEGTEYFRDVNTQGYKITIRATDITTKDVIEYKGRQFQIQYITNPLEYDYILELNCVEKLDKTIKRGEL